MAFASLQDVKTAYEGTIAAEAEARVQYLLDTVSARLRILLPDLTQRIADDDTDQQDLSILTKDIVVQAVLRRLPGNAQQVRSQSQGVGPWSTTLTYTTDSTGTFSDEDLAALRGSSALSSGRVGTIKLGTLVDWSNQ